MFWGKSEPDEMREKRILLEPFDLTEEIENHLIERMQERRFHKGDVIVREGDVGDSLYVVASGSLLVLKRNDAGREIEVATMETGDFFGEMSLFMDKQRSSTVVAAETCRLFEILNKRSVEYLIDNTPQLKTELKRAFMLRRHNDRTKLRQGVAGE